MKFKVVRTLSLLVLLFTSTSVHAFYNPALGKWVNRDPAGERFSQNLDSFSHNVPTIRVDVLGLYDPYSVPNTRILMPDIRNTFNGVTSFDPALTFIRITTVANVLGLRECYCRLLDADYDYAIKIGWGFNFNMDTVEHEGLHAYTDHQLATTAMPYAIDYMKSLRVRGMPNLSACRRYFQTMADAAVSKMIDIADNELAHTVHDFIGQVGWSASGENQFISFYLPTWLGQNFPAPPQPFW